MEWPSAALAAVKAMPRQALGFFTEAEEVLLVRGDRDRADGELGLAEIEDGPGAQGGVVAFFEGQVDGTVRIFAELITSGRNAVDGDVRVGDVRDHSAGFTGEALDIDELSLALLTLGGNEKGALSTELVEGEVRPDFGAGGEHADDVVLSAPALE